MRKSKVRRSLVAILLVVFALFFIAGTYARYSTTANADIAVNIAKWAVKISNDNNELTETTQDITFVVEPNNYVVSNKIAPATKATAEIELDLTGTEVAVDFASTIDYTKLSNLVKANGQIKFTTTFNGVTYSSDDTVVIPLVNGSAFTSSNGKKTLTLAIEWTNDDSNDTVDTAVGEASETDRTITVPVTLTAQQHIDE